MPAWLRALWPEPPSVSLSEQWRAVAGTVLAVLLTGLLGQALHLSDSHNWLLPPLGASAVLLMAMPSSPFTQPWSVVAGNGLSAWIGLAASHWVPQPELAAALAVGAALLTMFALRCLHPPGGAVALLVVLSGTQDWGFALGPVMLSSLLMVLLATLYHRLTGRAYPRVHHPAAELAKDGAAPATHTRLTPEDLDAALRHYNQVIDLDREDLQALLHDAQAHAYQRTLGQLRCRDIMSTALVTVSGAEPLAQAWQRLLAHRIKSLPVVDAVGHVVGIITRSDFIAHWHGEHPGQHAPDDDTPVRRIMSRQVRVASDSTRVLDLLPLFSQGGHHHLPIVNQDHVLVGMVTESDVVRALHRELS